MPVTIDKLLGEPLLHKHKDSDISDFTVLDNRYVNVSGDTLTGVLNFVNSDAQGQALITSINSATTTINWSRISKAGSTLADFGTTTSAQLASVISDKTGSGALVFGTSPTFTTQITTPLIIGTNIKPSVNSTTAIQLQNAAGTSILNVDTTNGRVGIGTTGPASKLSVSGGASIGSGYAGTAAPTNGMIIQGNVGIGTTSPNTTLHINGGVSVKVVTKTASYTMLTSDCVILANASSNPITITLPSATKTGMLVMIKKVDNSANAVTVSRSGTNTIEGATTVSLAVRYSSVTLVANGTSTWYKVSTT